MEDGGALGYLFENIHDARSVPERLELFQRVRADRVARVQILSQVKLGREKEVEEQVRRYADPRGSSKSHVWFGRRVTELTGARRADEYG
jgi:salicylate hydroxylase